VQLVAGLILDEGWAIEEATGEGKTIACYPAIYMAWLHGMHTHLVTVNDVLVVRDAEFVRPVFELLGVTVGFITADMPCYGPEAEVRQRAYACDLTYGTNNEFGFDYLRDNMKLSTAEQVQKQLDFAIVDEVDSILIDEARTPLIISGAAHGNTELFGKADAVCREIIERNRPWGRLDKRVESLKREVKALEGELDKAGGDGKAETVEKKLQQTQEALAEAEKKLSREAKLYEVKLEHKSAHLTDEGVRVAQDIAGVGSFYVGSNMDWPHLMEQSLRAHLVYERDKEYIVREARVVIVDEFTGRLLEGREWSEGLHQAVEAKERVPIKEETQTLATITLQNFFRLYKKLAGMTGTAMTEANEFLKIYKLDAAAVPTHRPVNRVDYDDRIYAEIDAKYDAIVEEIRKYSRDLRRPVLVGTTSIEKSEKLSDMLQRRYGVEHQVLNGRPENAAREHEIVAWAGHRRPLKKDSKEMVGVVTIATNMAGRGTDIKLGAGVVYEKCKVPSAEKLAELGVEVEDLFPPGTTKCCLHCPQYNPVTSCAHCFKPKIESGFPLRGRTDCVAEAPCGLHIVGTERHEARRIDNQLRGRSGRQGDPGSSRFFLSLRDDLVAVFAGPWTLKVLGWLGLQGGENIEHPRISNGIARAQRKVEERNFETRKNLLEYDEVMDYQRRTFYSQRQKILEGRELEGLVMNLIRHSVQESVADYLDGRYAQRCIAEWARQNLQILVEDDQIRAESMEDLHSLEENLRGRAREEANNVISMTLGEYMDEELDREEWDLRGLSSWAMSRFNVNLSQNQLRKMSIAEVDQALLAAAGERIDQINLAPLAKYLEEGFVAESLTEWVRNKFLIDASAAELTGAPEEVQARLIAKVEAAYQRREIEYPVEYAIDMTVAQAGTENVYALGRLVEWANRKFDAGLTVESLQGAKIEDVRKRLVALAEEWRTGGQLEEAIRRSLGSNPDPEPAMEFAKNRFDTELKAEEFNSDVFGRVVEAGRQFLRREMTELERFVLLQIYDSTWKDHLLAMDHLKSGIGLRSYAEQDPRVAYKREGSRMFQEMLAGVREKVTDMIFKVRLAAGQEMESVYQISSMVHEQLTGYDHLAQEMAQQAQGELQKVQTIIRQAPKVGRNDPCPCGSGKKYKKCCGKNL
ncbi:MAG TPA: SEC-C metal-binding domain-containing protein, partial [Phycisphaerae bacterium]|nr:SEC-C metal-binding domain-containing protein [Phycisphaerae bacterium]